MTSDDKWYDAKGEGYRLKDMTTRHIANCFDYVSRQYEDHGKTEHLIWIKRFEAELNRRLGEE